VSTERAVPAGSGSNGGVMRCAQGCKVIDLINRLEQCIDRLTETWNG
jgi:hypothetical protein